MSRTDTWLPLYVGDYLGDTMRLSTLEHGAYLLLLMEYWRQGPLPDDDKALANITKVPRGAWLREVGPSLRSFFDVHEDGLLHQKRMDAEIERVANTSAVRRTAAVESWNKRNANAKKNGDKPHANGVHPGYDSRAPALQSQLHSESSSLRSEEDSVSLRSTRGEKTEFKDIRDELFNRGGVLVSQLTGKPIAPSKKFVGKLLKLAADDCAVVLAALYRATEHRPVDPAAWLTQAVSGRRNSEDRLAEDWGLTTFGSDGS
jgi:uncharacterized protein YdaU (DUF1376 family)